MSVINFTNMNENAVPAPAPGEVNIFSNSGGDLAYKDENGQVNLFGAVFGKNFANKKKTSDQTTTQRSFQAYDSIIAPADGNNYLVYVRYVWGYSSGSTDFRGRILINGSQALEEHRQEPKDGGNDQRYHFSTMTLAVPSGGNVEVEIEFAAGSSGNQARLYESEIILWRID